MKQKELWINQIKGLCICLVVIYHSVITFYPHLTTFQHPLSEVLSKCWIYFNLYLAPFRMPVFFFISGYLIRRYIDSVPWGNCLDKRIWNIFWVLALWGVVQWLALSALNQWLAPERDLSNASNAAYADSTGEFLHGMITASTSLWYLYALIVYFVVCKIFSRLALPSADGFFAYRSGGRCLVVYYLAAVVAGIDCGDHEAVLSIRATIRYALHQPAECDWLQHHCYLHHPSHSG